MTDERIQKLPALRRDVPYGTRRATAFAELASAGVPPYEASDAGDAAVRRADLHPETIVELAGVLEGFAFERRALGWMVTAPNWEGEFVETQQRLNELAEEIRVGAREARRPTFEYRIYRLQAGVEDPLAYLEREIVMMAPAGWQVVCSIPGDESWPPAVVMGRQARDPSRDWGRG